MLDLRHLDALRYWSMARVHKYSLLQQRMLVAAYKLLRPGGVLVYSTCTFGPEENEHPVDHLLRHRPDVTVEPVPAAAGLPNRRQGLRSWGERTFDPRLADAVRIVPTAHMEGFFVCRLRKQ
jgi:16S rRNA (cytosine1407-C5)-methyltransferase